MAISDFPLSCSFQLTEGSLHGPNMDHVQPNVEMELKPEQELVPTQLLCMEDNLVMETQCRRQHAKSKTVKVNTSVLADVNINNSFNVKLLTSYH